MLKLFPTGKSQTMTPLTAGEFGMTSPLQVTEGVVPSCAVLVVSCDKYRDLWQPFFNLLWKYWPDLPFHVYLGTNNETYTDERVTTLLVGTDHSWSRNLRWFLQQIDTDYVLTLFDDFFLEENIQTANLLQHLRELRELDGTVLRLFPKPGPDRPVPGRRTIGAIHPKAPYRVSAQPAFWHRTKLLEMLRDEEDAWEWEWNGTERSRSSPGFFATYQALLPYRHVVERGQWFWSAARDLRRQNVGCDFEARPVMGPLTAAKKATNRFRKDLISSLLPVHLRRRR